MDKVKVEGLLRLKLNAILQPFSIYGLDIFISPAIDAIIEIINQLYDVKGNSS